MTRVVGCRWEGGSGYLREKNMPSYAVVYISPCPRGVNFLFTRACATKGPYSHRSIRKYFFQSFPA